MLSEDLLYRGPSEKASLSSTDTLEQRPEASEAT